jgi:hypothetical protein
MDKLARRAARYMYFERKAARFIYSSKNIMLSIYFCHRKETAVNQHRACGIITTESKHLVASRGISSHRGNEMTNALQADKFFVKLSDDSIQAER